MTSRESLSEALDAGLRGGETLGGCTLGGTPFASSGLLTSLSSLLAPSDSPSGELATQDRSEEKISKRFKEQCGLVSGKRSPRTLRHFSSHSERLCAVASSSCSLSDDGQQHTPPTTTAEDVPLRTGKFRLNAYTPELSTRKVVQLSLQLPESNRTVAVRDPSNVTRQVVLR